MTRRGRGERKVNEMGCDIHLIVESRTCSTWRHVDVSFYDGRNYNLFAILADVRNATCGDTLTPIAPPRGVPKDASAPYCELVNSWQGDGHSHSWHSLRHLLQFDWTQNHRSIGVMDPEQYVQWVHRRKHKSVPGSYAASISGPNLTTIREDEADAMIAARITDWPRYGVDKLAERALYGYVVRCEWTSPYFASCSHFWAETMPRLISLSQSMPGGFELNLDNLRIGFFFDS